MCWRHVYSLASFSQVIASLSHHHPITSYRSNSGGGGLISLSLALFSSPSLFWPLCLTHPPPPPAHTSSSPLSLLPVSVPTAPEGTGIAGMTGIAEGSEGIKGRGSERKQRNRKRKRGHLDENANNGDEDDNKQNSSNAVFDESEMMYGASDAKLGDLIQSIVTIRDTPSNPSPSSIPSIDNPNSPDNPIEVELGVTYTALLASHQKVS